MADNYEVKRGEEGTNMAPVTTNASIENATHDYIVIGSGSAGSTIAYRLGEVPEHNILVLEFGKTDIGPFIQMPAPYPIL